MTWAANIMKLRRAEATCGVGAIEEAIKAEYIRIGGLVLDVAKDVEVEPVVEEVIVVEKPKKVVKKVAKKLKK